MSALDTLTRVQNLIRDPAHWTTGAFSRDADNHIVDQHKKLTRGCKFCAVGALAKAKDTLMLRVFDSLELKLLSQAIGEVGDGSVYAFNDNPETTHADIMQMFDKARELAANA